MDREEDTNPPLPAAIDNLPAATVPISSLITTDSPRLSGVNRRHARLLAGMPDRLPPIIVHRPTMRVIDGMHRLQAARIRDEQDIEVRFFDGDQAAAFVIAVQANTAHGLALTLTDRKAAADRIIRLYPHWSDRAIASVTGISPPTVATRRKRLADKNFQLDTRIGRDGKAHPVDPAQRRETATRLLKHDPDASLRDVARQAGLSPETIRGIRAQLSPARTSREDTSPANGRGSRKHLPDRNARPSRAAGTAAVQALRADPAFRSTDNGRALLRLLTALRALGERGSEYLDHVPDHCLDNLADAARACVQDWQEFSAQIDHRRALINEPARHDTVR